MAATIELKILTNEKEVSASLSNIQQRLNQLTSKKYEIKIETNIDKVSDSVIKYINAQARLETAHAKTLAAEAKLTTSQNNLAAARERTTQTANRLAAAEERTTQTENQLSAAQERTQQSANRLAAAEERTTQEMLRNERQERSLQNSTNDLSAAFKRLGSILLSELRQAFNAALTEMKAVDTELVTIQKVTGESAQGMKRYANDAYQVAAKLGASAHEYLNAVAEFAKAGYKDQSKALGQLAITTKVVGDTTIATANQFLLSVDAAYKYQGSIEKLTAVLDGANEIGNNYATSVEKIAQGLGKVSPIAAQAHVGIDELSAAIGTITAVTQRSGTEAATALRALYLNIIGDTKTEIEDGAKWTAGEIEGLRDVLRKYAPDAVKAAEATGSIINPMEAIGALANAMKNNLLTEADLMEMVSDIGGKLRTSQLLALIQNFDMYQKQLKTFQEAAGSAAREFSIYLDSWEAKTNKLSAAWTNFVQKQISSRTIKNLIDDLTRLIKNLDSIGPLIKAIGVAIAGLNLQKLYNTINKLITSLTMLKESALGPLGIAIAAVAVAIGVYNSALEKAANNARKQAEESKERSDKALEEANAFMELSTQLGAAKVGSSEYISISAQMQQALKDEGIEVRNLTEDYRNLTKQKLETAEQAAKKEYADAGLALRTAYNTELKTLRLGYSPVSIEGFTSSGLFGKDSLENQIYDMFRNSSAAKVSVVGGLPSYRAADTSINGIVAFYQLAKSAIETMDKEIYALFEKGEEEAADKIKSSNLYKDIQTYIDTIGDDAEAYLSAQEKWHDASTALEGYGTFNSLIDWLQGDNVTKDQYASFLATLEKANDLSLTQKNYLREMGKEIYPVWTAELTAMNGGTTELVNLLQELEESTFTTTDELENWINALYKNNAISEETAKALEILAKDKYPELARAILMAKSAISQFNEAVKNGEKDDGFKDYKSAYDAVIKAGKKGAYGSNAFQYGIKALVDPEIIERFKGDWAGLVKYIQTTQGALYKDSESMGQGLLDKIYEAGDKAGKSIREIRDGEKLLASYNKKTGEWMISNDPEDIKKLAGKLGMSAESLVAAGIALGAMDPNADIEGLSKALETILGGGEEKLTAEQEAALKNEAAAQKNETSSNTFADAVTVFASAAEGLAAKFGGPSPSGGETPQESAQNAREAAINAARGSNAAVITPKTISDHSQTSAHAALEQAQSGREAAIAAAAGSGVYPNWGVNLGKAISALSDPKAFFESGIRVIASKFGLSAEYGPTRADFEASKKKTGVVTWGKEFGPTRADFIYNPTDTGVVFGPTRADYKKPAYSPGAGALDAANAKMAAWYQERYGGSKYGDMSDAELRKLGIPAAHAGAQIPSGAIYVPRGVASGNESPIPVKVVSEGGSQSAAQSARQAAIDAARQSNNVLGDLWNGLDAAASSAGIGYGDRAPGKGVFTTFLESLFGKSASGGEGGGAKITVDATEAQTTIDDTKAALDELNNTEAEATATVDAEGAKNGAAEANDAIAGIVKSVTTDVYVNVHVSGGGKYTHGGSGMESEGDGSLMFGGRATGDKDFHGGPVLVNDEPGGYNPELIVADGRAFIANGGNPTVVDLPRGSVIYNADETRDILNGGSDLFNIPSFANAPFSSGKSSKKYSGKGSKKTSGAVSDSSGSSSSSDSSMSDDDMLKKLNEYMEQILDAAHDALDDQLEAINAQIYALKYQTEAAEKASALEEARLELLQAEQNLLDANTERTVRYYNAATGQWEWMADQREVLRAQEELADAQKNLLEAEYDALATAWSELKDEIEKALKEEGGPIDINAVLAALGKSAASGSKSGVQALIKDIFGYTDDPRAYANFDGGGIANGLGWMPKGNAGSEAVLDSNITNAILNPVTNAAFQGFTDSLTSLFQLAGGGIGLPSSRYGGNVSNLYGGNTYIEGVKIGSDMMNRPLSEVLSTLNLYKNA